MILTRELSSHFVTESERRKKPKHGEEQPVGTTVYKYCVRCGWQMKKHWAGHESHNPH